MEGSLQKMREAARVRRKLTAVAVIGAMFSVVLVLNAPTAGAQGPTCRGEPATHVGTPGNDLIRGTDGDDVIVAMAGNDRVFAGDGDDLVCLGPGNDWAKGQKGFDFIVGDVGNDVIFGNAKADILIGGPGNDTLWGGVGPDELFGGPGNDVIKAGHGNDLVNAGLGRDNVAGSTGADEIWGSGGNDIITGGKGFDDIFAGAGDDLITGGPGQDLIDGETGTDRCRIDITDSIFGCEDGAVRGETGFDSGFFTVDLDPEFILPTPVGPSSVLYTHIEPLEGQTARLIVRDPFGAVLFDGISFETVNSNLWILGDVASVEVTGAEFYVTNFMKTSVLYDNLIALEEARGAQVFGVAPSEDGGPIPARVVVTNDGGLVTPFEIYSIGDHGVFTELEIEVEPGTTREFTGSVPSTTRFIAVFGANRAFWSIYLDGS